MTVINSSLGILIKFEFWFYRPDQIACAAGEYSLAKSTSCTRCPAGYACATISSSPTACTAGTYSLGGNTSCTNCDPGYACPSTSSLTNRYPCPSGKSQQDSQWSV